MTNTDKISELRGVVDTELQPLISSDYMLADAPYYHNIGDVFIWEGIRNFCKGLPGRNLGTSNLTTCLFPEISRETTILLMGGGNFGDLWRGFQDFRLEAVRRYPHNRIVMFPQSVWYNDPELIKKDAEVFCKHGDLHLCARDKYSFEFMRGNFPSCDVRLVPDMAFYIGSSLLSSYKHKDAGRKLYLKRMDKELVDETVLRQSDGYEIHDWPTYEKDDRLLWFTQRLQGVAYRTKDFPPINRLTARLTDATAQFAVRRNLVRTGLSFLSPYSEILTTRLHTMIMGFLLDKPVRYIDNTSGKLSAFANTWLQNVEYVKPFHAV